MKRGLPEFREFLALWGVLITIVTAGGLLVVGTALAFDGAPFEGAILVALSLAIISALAVSL